MENKEVNRKFDRLINRLRSAGLTDAEKIYSKNVILNAVEDSAVRNGNEVRLNHERSILTKLIYKRMPVFLAIAMLFSGGVSFAAEGALPGDLLYPVKMGVNENVGQVLAFGTEAKAEFEAKLAARRAEEMERLSEKGEISPEVAEKLKINFELRAENARKHLAELEANGRLGAAIEANSQFHDLLEKRIAIFKDRIDEDGSDKEEFKEFLAKIREERERSVSAQLDIETKLKAGVSADFEHRAEGKMKAAENKIAEVARFIESNKDTVSAEVYADSSAKLNAANRLMAEARVKLEAKAYGEAFILFHKAFSTAMQAKELLIREAARERHAEIELKIEEKRTNADADDADETEESDEDDKETNKERGGNDRSAEVKIKVGL